MTNDVQQVVERLRERHAEMCDETEGMESGDAEVLRLAADLIVKLASPPAPSGDDMLPKHVHDALSNSTSYCLDNQWGCEKLSTFVTWVKGLEATANSEPAPSGWQQRIAAIRHGLKEVMHHADDEAGFMEPVRQAWYALHEFEALVEQNASDFGLFLKSLESGLTALQAFMGDGRHAHTCNGDEDGPCDCGYVDPEDVVEAMLMDVRTRQGTLLPMPESSPSLAHQLGSLLQESGLVPRFGLRGQGKYETVERMRADGASWDEIGKAIGWSGRAVERHFTSEADALPPAPEGSPAKPEFDTLRCGCRIIRCPECDGGPDGTRGKLEADASPAKETPLPELPMVPLCPCCECQGKKCLAPHPGHSHRYADVTKEWYAAAARAEADAGDPDPTTGRADASPKEPRDDA